MDFTSFTFFVTNMALLAAGLFLWLERDNVNPKWKTALSVSGMVCFIAAVHYYYMRGNMENKISMTILWIYLTTFAIMFTRGLILFLNR